jgi:hypothetical protein
MGHFAGGRPQIPAENPGPWTLNSGAWAAVGALGRVLVVSAHHGLWCEPRNAKREHIT